MTLNINSVFLLQSILKYRSDTDDAKDEKPKKEE